MKIRILDQRALREMFRKVHNILDIIIYELADSFKPTMMAKVLDKLEIRLNCANKLTKQID